jgi:quercetin dioxygenase-like cupin family protein
MSRVDKGFALGKLSGLIMDFQLVGDKLPMHTHGSADVHITIVARGSFTARGDGWEREVKSGDVLDWQPEQPHEFEALEDRSRIVNIIKGG